MKIIAGQRTSVFVPMGSALLVAASTGTGTIRPIDMTGNREPRTPIPFTGVAQTLGPIDTISGYALECVMGEMNYTIEVVTGTYLSRLQSAQKRSGSVSAGDETTFYLPIGSVLTVSAAVSIGSVIPLALSGNPEPGTPFAFGGSALTFGPYEQITLYRIVCHVGTMTFNSAFAVEQNQPPALPGATGTLSGSAISTTAIQLVFTNATDATSYEYRINAGSWLTLSVSKIISGLTINTAYDDIQVRGVNITGEGPASNAVDISTLASEETIVITPLTLSWEADSEAGDNPRAIHFTGNDTITAGDFVTLYIGEDDDFDVFETDTLQLTVEHFETILAMQLNFPKLNSLFQNKHYWYKVDVYRELPGEAAPHSGDSNVLDDTTSGEASVLTTKYSAINKSAHVTLNSPANDTETGTNGVGSFHGVAGVNGRVDPGLYYFELGGHGTGGKWIGIANDGVDFTSELPGTNEGIAFAADQGSFGGLTYNAGGNYDDLSPQRWANNERIGVAFLIADTGGGVIKAVNFWVRDATGWFSGDPDTNSGGKAIAVPVPIFPYGGTQSDDGTTLYCKNAVFTLTKPSTALSFDGD